MIELITCKTCGVESIPDTWFGECKRCYDLYDQEEDKSMYEPNEDKEN